MIEGRGGCGGRRRRPAAGPARPSSPSGRTGRSHLFTSPSARFASAVLSSVPFCDLLLYLPLHFQLPCLDSLGPTYSLDCRHPHSPARPTPRSLTRLTSIPPAVPSTMGFSFGKPKDTIAVTLEWDQLFVHPPPCARSPSAELSAPPITADPVLNGTVSLNLGAARRVRKLRVVLSRITTLHSDDFRSVVIRAMGE